METSKHGTGPSIGTEREREQGGRSPGPTEQAGEWAGSQARAVGDRVRETAGQAAEQLQEGMGRVKDRVTEYGQNLSG